MAGEIRPIKPNALQRLIHQIISMRILLPFFAENMHRIDSFLLQITGGKYSLSELGGWTIIQLTTIGAKTGQERTMPLLAGIDEDKIALIASSFGRKHNPGWYYNLKAHPECTAAHKGHSIQYVAREVTGDEYEKYWRLVASSYMGYEKYKIIAAHRHIPVLLLEPKKQMLRTLVLTFCLLTFACSPMPAATTTPTTPGTDADLDVAVSQARDSLNTFIETIATPHADRTYVAVKVHFSPRDEFPQDIWVDDVTYADGIFRGNIGDDIPSMKLEVGERIAIDEDDLLDWMIVQDGKLIGGYTIRLAIQRMSPDERERFFATLDYEIED